MGGLAEGVRGLAAFSPGVGCCGLGIPKALPRGDEARSGVCWGDPKGVVGDGGVSGATGAKDVGAGVGF